MSGAKLGDRLLVVGCSDPALIAALAIKAGLTGRACAVDTDPARSRAPPRAVEREGALVETAATPLPTLPFDADAFDVVVLRDVLGGRPLDSRASLVRKRGVSCGPAVAAWSSTRRPRRARRPARAIGSTR